MRRQGYEVESGPATLGSTAKAHLRLIVWCKSCRHEVRLGPAAVAEEAARYGAGLSVIDWAKRLRCSRCGERNADFVISGYIAPQDRA